MCYDIATTVAFTGHRSYAGQSREELSRVLMELYDAGYRTFLSGMAVGFDMAAAEAVEELRSIRPDVRLVCVVPFAGQDARFSQDDRERYHRLLAAAAAVECVCESYRPCCYALRNNRLVECASVVVAWYDGTTGGTQYTVRRALRYGRRVIALQTTNCPTLFFGK